MKHRLWLVPRMGQAYLLEHELLKNLSRLVMVSLPSLGKMQFHGVAGSPDNIQHAQQRVLKLPHFPALMAQEFVRGVGGKQPIKISAANGGLIETNQLYVPVSGEWTDPHNVVDDRLCENQKLDVREPWS